MIILLYTEEMIVILSPIYRIGGLSYPEKLNHSNCRQHRHEMRANIKRPYEGLIKRNREHFLPVTTSAASVDQS